MIIHTVEMQSFEGRWKSCVRVEIEGRGRFKNNSSIEDLWIDWPSSYCAPEEANGDPFLLICLPIAMRLKERLVSRSPISQALLINVLEAMEIYSFYFPDLCEIVEIDCVSEVRTRSPETRIASFYSGGVDSIYNIAEHRRLNEQFGVPLVSDLWLVQGMDIALDQVDLWNQTKERLIGPDAQHAAPYAADVRTNARDLHNGIVPWEELGFSAILGGLAKCFSPMVNTALIGSYARYKDVIPHSSSPLVDPMWSCDRQSIRHFSARVDRQEKIGTIIQHSPELLKQLRVCWKNPGDVYNCGECEKCLRTQLGLLIGGGSDLSDSFRKSIEPRDLRRLDLPGRAANQYAWDFWRDLGIQCRAKGLTAYAKEIDGRLAVNRLKRAFSRFF